MKLYILLSFILLIGCSSADNELNFDPSWKRADFSKLSDLNCELGPTTKSTDVPKLSCPFPEARDSKSDQSALAVKYYLALKDYYDDLFEISKDESLKILDSTTTSLLAGDVMLLYFAYSDYMTTEDKFSVFGD